MSGYLHRVYIIHPNCSFTFLRCLLSAQSRRLDGEDGTASALGRAAEFQVRVRDDLSVQHLGPGQLRRGGPGALFAHPKDPTCGGPDPGWGSEGGTQPPVPATPLLLQSCPWGRAWTLSPEAHGSVTL